jgi:hypothetical protein
MKIWPLLLAIPTLAHAYYPSSESSCSAVDLRNETLGSVRNQGEISWCYAFTAADMLAHTFEKFERISAADIALNYNQSLIGTVMGGVYPSGTPHETGFNKVALKRAMKEGYCPEDIFPSESWTKVTPDGEEKILMPQAMKEIAQLHKKRDSLTLNNLPFHIAFKNVGPQEFLTLIKSKKLTTFYKKLRHQVCENDRMPYDARWKTKMVFRNPRVFSRLSEQLERGRPVGLDYDSRILKDELHRGVKLSELHTSSVVGRRWNTEKKSCEYLIRDSYGAQCTRYDESYECQDGNVWLNESQIYGNMTSIVYMLSPPR